MTALWVLGALSLAVPLIPFRYLAVAGQLPWLAGALLRYLPAAVCAGLGGVWLWQRRRETLGGVHLGWPVATLLLAGLLSAAGAREPGVSAAKTLWCTRTFRRPACMRPLGCPFSLHLLAMAESPPV